MPVPKTFEQWWAIMTPEYKKAAIRIAHGSAAEQVTWLNETVFGASCSRKYLNRVKSLTSQNVASSSSTSSETAPVQQLAYPVPKAPLSQTAESILVPITPVQQVINLTATTQALAVPSIRTCARTTFEMLFNSPVFMFYQALDLEGVRSPLLSAYITSLQARKYAAPGRELNHSAQPMEYAFSQMRYMSQSNAIHQLCGDREKFKVFITSSIQCAAPGCGEVVERHDDPTGSGLTIGPGANAVGATAAFDNIQQVLDHYISQSSDRYNCPVCQEPNAESKIARISLPDTLILHIDMRKVRYSSTLEVRMPSITNKYRLECGLTTQYLPDDTEYSAFWRDKTNLYWYMGHDDQFTDIQAPGTYAVQKPAEDLPPYPTVLVYTSMKYIGTPFAPYQARANAPVVPPAATSFQSPTKTKTKTKKRKLGETTKIVKIIGKGKDIGKSIDNDNGQHISHAEDTGKTIDNAEDTEKATDKGKAKAVATRRTKRNTKPVGGLLFQQPPMRRSNRLQKKPAATIP